jgi:hypothetical protein
VIGRVEEEGHAEVERHDMKVISAAPPIALASGEAVVIFAGVIVRGAAAAGEMKYLGAAASLVGVAVGVNADAVLVLTKAAWAIAVSTRSCELHPTIDRDAAARTTAAATRRQRQGNAIATPR